MKINLINITTFNKNHTSDKNNTQRIVANSHESTPAYASISTYANKINFQGIRPPRLSNIKLTPGQEALLKNLKQIFGDNLDATSERTLGQIASIKNSMQESFAEKLAGLKNSTGIALSPRMVLEIASSAETTEALGAKLQFVETELEKVTNILRTSEIEHAAVSVETPVQADFAGKLIKMLRDKWSKKEIPPLGAMHLGPIIKSAQSVEDADTKFGLVEKLINFKHPETKEEILNGNQICSIVQTGKTPEATEFQSIMLKEVDDFLNFVYSKGVEKDYPLSAEDICEMLKSSITSKVGLSKSFILSSTKANIEAEVARGGVN